MATDTVTYWKVEVKLKEASEAWESGQLTLWLIKWTGDKIVAGMHGSSPVPANKVDVENFKRKINEECGDEAEGLIQILEREVEPFRLKYEPY